MAIINKGTSFANGEQLTAQKINNMLDLAVFNSSAADNSTTFVNSLSQIAVAGGGINTAQLADDAVETSNIKDANVTKAKIENVADYKVLGNVSGVAAAPAEVDILDEETMSSDSATSLATQKSIKAYVDAGVETASVKTYRSIFTQCPAAGESQSFSHGLSGVPEIVSVQLKAKIAGDGFAQGEIVILANTYAYSSYGQGIEVNSSNVVFHTGPNGLLIIRPNGSYNIITEANFMIKVIAAIL